jgi:hypothetical protein
VVAVVPVVPEISVVSVVTVVSAVVVACGAQAAAETSIIAERTSARSFFIVLFLS